MYGKHTTVGLIASVMLATTAFAQTPSTTAPATSSSMTTTSTSGSSFQGNWRTSKVVGLNVYNDGNESLGSINDLLTDKQGKIVAVVIGVGGFLGVGERYAAIPFEKVKFVNEPRANAMAGNSAMPGTRPTPSTTTTGAATGAVAPGTTTTTAPGGTAMTTTAATPNPWYPDHAVVSATKDEIKAMAEFKYTN